MAITGTSNISNLLYLKISNLVETIKYFPAYNILLFFIKTEEKLKVLQDYIPITKSLQQSLYSPIYKLQNPNT